MRKFFRRLLVKLGIIKSNVVTGKEARVVINGREVDFANGETVDFNFNPKPINVLGQLEVVELNDHSDIEMMVRGKK